MAETIIIDATQAVFGRLCSYAAKQALNGNDIIILNSEKAVITGSQQNIIKKQNELKQKKGHSMKSPKYINIPYQILKRGIRGMLPNFRSGQGKVAFSKIKCYNGVPEEFKDKKMEPFQKPTNEKYMYLKDLCNRI